MLIELEPAKPNFSRCWATDGGEDFKEAGECWESSHMRCGDGRTTKHLRFRSNDDAADGLYRMWFFCDGCDRQRLILGPPDDPDMEPVFPRLQVSRVH